MSPVVGASIDVGSNSVHLLVASVANHRLSTLADESVFLGLGKAVAERGLLGPAARTDLADALAHYAAVAHDLGAATITVGGTEPIRRSADGPAIVRAVATRSRLDLHVLAHEEEALLTVIGVMAGRPVEHETLVIDVGGGSSEFSIVGPVTPPRASGLRLGAARLTDRHVSHDPPTTAELQAMEDDARRILMAESAPTAPPHEIVGVGGTVSNLLKVVQPGATDGTLTLEEMAVVLRALSSEPAQAAAGRYGLRDARVRILPAGAVIVDAILRRFGADSLRVSEAGIREGMILAVAHAGVGWRDRLPRLAHGWLV